MDKTFKFARQVIDYRDNRVGRMGGRVATGLPWAKLGRMVLAWNSGLSIPEVAARVNVPLAAARRYIETRQGYPGKITATEATAKNPAFSSMVNHNKARRERSRSHD